MDNWSVSKSQFCASGFSMDYTNHQKFPNLRRMKNKRAKIYPWFWKENHHFLMLPGTAKLLLMQVTLARKSGRPGTTKKPLWAKCSLTTTTLCHQIEYSMISVILSEDNCNRNTDMLQLSYELHYLKNRKHTKWVCSILPQSLRHCYVASGRSKLMKLCIYNLGASDGKRFICYN